MRHHPSCCLCEVFKGTSRTMPEDSCFQHLRHPAWRARGFPPPLKAYALHQQPIFEKMMSKWSAKPADYKAARLRNNQRRHRKKVRDHVAELESRLSETQLQLDQALSRIAELSEELPRTRLDPMLLESYEAPKETPTTRSEAATDEQSWLSINHSPRVAQGLDHQHYRLAARREEDEMKQQTDLTPGLSISREVSTWSPPPVLSAPWTSSIAVQALDLNFEAFADFGDQDCCSLPIPEPGRPTTRCRDAYFIITQQNYKAVDISVIRGWLEPGFRGPLSEGDGCRVDTVLLFTLLDWISSP